MIKQEVTPLNTTYVNDMNEATKKNALKSYIPKNSFRNNLTLPTPAFSETGSMYLPVVKATKGKMDGTPVIRLSVLTQSGGITVTIFCHDELIYRRYRSLLLWMKHNHMEVTFPFIRINNGRGRAGLYFTSNDFIFKSPNDPPEPAFRI